MRRDHEYVLSIGDGVATMRRKGSRAYTTARILGREMSESGYETIWLDRLIAPHGIATVEGWKVGGAVSSVLTRRAGRAAAPAGT